MINIDLLIYNLCDLKMCIMKTQIWSKYYTPNTLSDGIVDSIEPKFHPVYVIDICAGSGNMLKSAQKRWPNSKFIGVDISISEKLINKNFQERNILFHEFDALNIGLLKRKIKLNGKKLILANPPFGKYYGTAYKPTKGLQKLYQIALKTNRIEILMLISNLSILNKGDYFGAVLPENIFTSEKMREFYIKFQTYFENIKVEYHKESFAGSEVKVRTFVAKYTGASKISDFKSNKNINNNISEKYSLIRGIDNTKILPGCIPDNSCYEVVHFNNLNGDIISKRHINDDGSKLLDKRIGKNDIIVIRVGRNAGTIIIPDQRHFDCLVSDHLIIIKNGRNLNKKSLKEAQSSLYASKKGLTTKYVSKNDIWSAIHLKQ